ncbi:MAG TPA: histidine phosphatase family protein [Chloroflexia bacterium]|nr:histidine phosphatase family protein [Chloroflexia bacterium]
MYIYLVRHGQSVWNAEERHQGWQNVPLSSLGERQAERVAQRLKEQSFDYYFTSPIYRCYQTAEAIVRAKNLEPQANLQVLEGLREARLSARMEGMLSKEMVKSWSEEEKRRFRDDYTFKFEDGESVQEVVERSRVTFREIAMLSEEAPLEPEEGENSAASRDVATQNPEATPGETAQDPKPDKPKIQPKTALVVAHRINIQLFVLQALGATGVVAERQTNIDRLEISNCALSVIEVNLKGKEPLFRLLTSNDVTHLTGLKAEKAG